MTRIRKRTNWAKYNTLVKRNKGKIDLNIRSPHDLDLAAETYKEILIKAYEDSCKESKVRTNLSTYWYNEKLREMKREIRKLHDKIYNGRNVINAELSKVYKTKIKNYHKECKKARSLSWIKFTEKLEDVKDIARIQKLMESEKPIEITTLIKSDGSYTNDKEEMISELMKTHFPDCKRTVKDKDSRTQQTTDDSMRSTYIKSTIEDIDKCITIERVSWAVSTLGPYKSAGEDGIFPALIQKSIETSAQILK